jgi:hypothetical protein
MIDPSRSAPVTSYAALLDRVIDDGLAEVREAYADPESHHKRDGAIEGFEACRGKAPGELAALWTEAEREAAQIMREGRVSGDATGYWRQRLKTAQIEWVCNVVSVGLVTVGQAPLLGHLPTERGAVKYASIVGVRAPEVGALQ